jgi:hypothetical protein
MAISTEAFHELIYSLFAASPMVQSRDVDGSRVYIEPVSEFEAGVLRGDELWSHHDFAVDFLTQLLDQLQAFWSG